MSKIMSVNAGSSSLKFKMYEMPAETVITEGIVERIGLEDAYFTIKIDGQKQKEVLPIKDHSVAVAKLLKELISRGIVKSLDEIEGIGHRIVQGGWYFNDSVLIDEDVVAKITELCALAPLHNPPHLVGIKAFAEVLPNVPMVAVFDTAFHQTMEEDAFMYAIPYEWYTEQKVRKYGAHGTSHKYVAYRCAELMGKDVKDLNIITCHLGNGASISAVKGGKCVDTSMGLTPLEGIPMGTRSGILDPTALEVVAKNEGKSISELITILNKQSGYFGISGISNDGRDLTAGLKAGNERCKLAFDIGAKRIVDYIASYYVYMGGADAICFTAGMGENLGHFRKNICDRLACLGVELDEQLNDTLSDERIISTPNSKVKVYIIPTNEEVMIARDVVRLTK